MRKLWSDHGNTFQSTKWFFIEYEDYFGWRFRCRAGTCFAVEMPQILHPLLYATLSTKPRSEMVAACATTEQVLEHEVERQDPFSSFNGATFTVEVPQQEIYAVRYKICIDLQEHFYRLGSVFDLGSTGKLG
jgi:hypothetical protein